jgi:hypothetical protein
VSSACRGLLAFAYFAAAPAAASAQSRQPIEISGGYTLLHEITDDEGFSDHGFRIDGQVPLWRIRAGRLGAVGEYSRNHNTTFHDYLTAMLGGVRLTFPSSGFVPFVQGLAGLEYCCDPHQNAFAFQIGGGVTKWLTRRFGAKGQVDFRRGYYSYAGLSKWYNEPVVGGSLVARF